MRELNFSVDDEKNEGVVFQEKKFLKKTFIEEDTIS